MSSCLSLLTLVRLHARRLADTAREVEPGAGKARSPVERRRPRWWRAARGGCGTSGRNACRQGRVKADREQDGSGSIPSLQRPSPPVRELRDTVLDHLGDCLACKPARLLKVGHLKTFVVDDGLVSADQVEVAVHGLPLRLCPGGREWSREQEEFRAK